MAHDITKDVIGCRELEIQKVNISGEAAEFFGEVTIADGSKLKTDAAPVDNEDIANKKYVDDSVPSGLITTEHLHSKLVASDGSPDPVVSCDDDGNVGIGTTTPSENLDISTTSGGTIYLNDTNSVQDLKITSGNAGVNRASILSGAYLDIGDAGTPTMSFYGGKVGIGTTSPAEPLEVQHSTQADFKLDTSTDSDSNRALIQMFHQNSLGQTKGYSFRSTGADNQMEIITSAGQSVMFFDNDLNVDIKNGDLTVGGKVILDSGNAVIRTDTTDGSDNTYLKLAGGGAESSSRGGVIYISGNEETNTGRIQIQSGNVAGASINLTCGGVDRVVTTSTETKIGGSTNYTEISNAGDVVFYGSGGLAFGEISMYNNSTADSIATATLTQLTRFDTNGVSNNTSPDHTNDHITITKAGIYKVSMSVAFSGTGSVTWTGGVYKNNGATQLTNLQTHRKLGASGDVGSATVTGLADLAINDTVEVWFQQNEGVNKDITVKDCTLSIIQVGGT